MSRTLRRFLIVAGVLLATPPIVLLGVVLLSPTVQPPPAAGLQRAREAMAAIARGTLPELSRLASRDGSVLAYRAYPAPGASRVAIVIHGAALSGFAMHPLATQLQAAGVTAYAPDIRGHGASGRRGDVDYVGQLEDDLEDLLRSIQPRHPGAHWYLIGHSMGGGFALRVAASPVGRPFSKVILLAPFLHPFAPTQQGGSGGWAGPNIPRIVGLTLLNRFRIHGLDGLPVIGYAMAKEDNAQLTPLYSWRLFSNFRPHEDYRSDFTFSAIPKAVFAAEDDEIFRGSQFGPLLAGLAPTVTVRVVAGVGHIGLVTEPKAIAQVIEALGN